MAIHFQLKHKVRADRVNDTAAAIGAKAAEALERAKLRRIIDDLEDEIALQMCTIGELVYATHCGKPSDSDTMQKILEYVDDLEGEIEGHEQQLKLLLGIVPCPICGKDIALDDVFCQNCGQALPVSPDRTI